MYEPTTWKNGNDGGETYLNAENLNHIETGIETNANDIARIDQQQKIDTGKIAELESAWDSANPFFKTGEYVTIPYTIDPGVYKSIDLKVNVPDGYILVALRRFGSGVVSGVLYKVEITESSKGEIAIGIRNVGTTRIEANAFVSGLFIRKDLLGQL